MDDPPIPLFESEVLDQVQDLEGIVLSKAPKVKVKIDHEKRGDNWNKKSIFLSYRIGAPIYYGIIWMLCTLKEMCLTSFLEL